MEFVIIIKLCIKTAAAAYVIALGSDRVFILAAGALEKYFLCTEPKNDW